MSHVYNLQAAVAFAADCVVIVAYATFVVYLAYRRR